MSTLQTTNLKHPDASGNQITFTSGGDVNFDNGAVYLDSANNRLGIGTSSPGANLQIVTSAVDSDVFAIRRQDSTTTNLFRFFQDSNITGGAGGAHLNTVNRDLAITASSAAGAGDGIFLKTTGEAGIGTTSPQTKLAVQSGSLSDGSILVGANYNGSGMNQNSDKLGSISFPMYQSDTYPKGFRGMMSYASSTVNFVQIGGGTNSARSATDVIFYTAASVSANGAERMRILPTGGITFNGDTATANALDDYEEGTWTPAIGSGGWSGITVSGATYTKIGSKVTVWVYINAFTGTGSSADFVLTGLPFTSSTNSYAPGPADFGNGGKVGSYARTEQNSNNIIFLVSSGTVGVSRLAIKGNEFNSGAYLIFSLTYNAV